MKRGRAGTALLVLALLALGVGTAAASTVTPVAPTGGGNCQSGAFFGKVAPEGNALVAITYPDPASGQQCVLADHQVLAGSTVQIWLYTPAAPANRTVDIAVEEFHPFTVQVAHPGPNGTVYYVPVTGRADVVWSNASVSAAAGEFQRFNLEIPPVFVAPNDAHNLTMTLLGLQLQFLIATPGTALPVPITVGGLVGWLAFMSPIAVVSFVAGFGPAAFVVHRLRYVSTGKYAAAFAFLLSLLILIGIGVDFTGFLYWLGSVGIGGLAVLLLLPMFVWGAAFWITVRGKRLKSRLIRSPIGKSENGEPVAGVTQVKVYGGGETGHEEELVEGLGVGGPGAAFHRLLGLRVKWRPDRIAREPRLVRYDWARGRLDIEGEYAAWPTGDGKKLDYAVRSSEVVWFPWRKAVKARYDPAPGEVVDHENDGVKDPALWHHRGFFLGLRHGEASVAALGSPDYVGPDQYIRGVAPAAAFGRESQRRGTALILLNERIFAEAEIMAHQTSAIHDVLQAFPGSPEAMEGLRQLSTRVYKSLFDPQEFLKRLEERGRLRADYRPPGASKYSTSSSSVEVEVREPLPPDLRGRALERGRKTA